MNSRVSKDDREKYGEMADLMLPAGSGFPSAAEAGVAGTVLDDILGWRPDIAPDLLRGLITVRDMLAVESVSWLEANDPKAYEAIRLAVFGAYYLNGDVQSVLGYRGQESRPVPEGEVPDYLMPGLLDPVRERGNRWRNPETEA